MIEHIVRQLTEADLDYMNENALDINKEEVKAMRGKTIKEVFMSSQEMFAACEVLEIEGDIVCIWGGIDVADGCMIWLLGTNNLDKYRKDFARITFKKFQEVKQIKDCLYSYVYTKNELTKDWLVKLGFTVFDGEPAGLNGEIFHRFEWRKECV